MCGNLIIKLNELLDIINEYSSEIISLENMLSVWLLRRDIVVWNFLYSCLNCYRKRSRKWSFLVKDFNLFSMCAYSTINSVNVKKYSNK